MRAKPVENAAPTTAPATDAAPDAPGAPEGAAASDAGTTRERLLAARVSDVIAAHPRALDLLIEHGFTLLAQPPLRRALAPTVTLAQAIRIRGLAPAVREALLEALERAGAADALEGSPCP